MHPQGQPSWHFFPPGASFGLHSHLPWEAAQRGTGAKPGPCLWSLLRVPLASRPLAWAVLPSLGDGGVPAQGMVTSGRVLPAVLTTHPLTHVHTYTPVHAHTASSAHPSHSPSPTCTNTVSLTHPHTSMCTHRIMSVTPLALTHTPSHTCGHTSSHSPFLTWVHTHTHTRAAGRPVMASVAPALSHSTPTRWRFFHGS